MRTLKESGAGVAHNPTSNLKLGSGIAPVAKMVELGLAVGIGTDGPASNNDLDMFEEMRLAALLAKGIGRDPTALPARDALAMATRLGAEAIDLGEIPAPSSPASAPISSSSISIRLTTCRGSRAIRAPCIQISSTPASRPMSST